jgi:putative ABC transport system permease protein
MQDIRAALRALSRRPGFAVIAILTLALGIGGNAAIFSLIDSVLLQPLPYPRADRLVMPWEFSEKVTQETGLDRLPVSAGDVTDFRTRNTTFERLAWLRGERFNLTGAGEPERINALRVSYDFFDVFGVGASVGRTFRGDDTLQTGTRLVVIGDRLWRRRFAADPSVPGRVVSLNAAPAVILGVMPPWFDFPAEGDLPRDFGIEGNVEIWSLDILTPAQQQARGGKSFAMLGRLKDGVDFVAAGGDLNAIAAEIAKASPESNGGAVVLLMSLRDQLVGGVRSALIMLLVAVGFVLLIACANVANLMLVRAAGRQREMCVRLALGAAPRRLVEQLLVESLVLATIAGVAGLGVAWVGLKVLLAMAPGTFAAISSATLDLRVVGFTVAVSALTGLTFGIVPAVQAARTNLNEGLRDGSRGTLGSRRAHRTRNVLVVVEVALATVLLVGAVLLLQTFVKLLNVDPGFRPDGILTMEVSLPRQVYAGPKAADFFDRVTARVAAVPGVQTVAVTSSVPLAGGENLRQITIEGRPRPKSGEELIADYRVVTPSYFQLMGIPQLSGLPLRETISGPAPQVVLINSTMASKVWPGEDPVGRKIKLTAYTQDSPWFTVGGVVGDTRHTGLDSSLRPQVYVELRSDPQPQMAVLVRAAGDPLGFAADARAAVREADPDQPVGRVRTMKAVVGQSVSNRRFTMALAGAFAVLAFGLSLLGLYAVVSHSVAERTREMGVRVALGASPSALLRLILGEGLALAGLGVVFGLIAAFIVTRFMAAMLYGVAARDANTFVFVPLLLFSAAALGCLVPARRAMRIDPITALRTE